MSARESRFGGQRKRMPRLLDRVDLPRLIGLLATAVAIGMLWPSPILKPVKLFVVFLHEASHALVAMATGGEVVGIQVLFTEGGAMRAKGGSVFLTLMAGYVGSLLWGGLILALAARTRLARVLAVVLGVAMALMTVLYVRNAAGFGFGILFALALAGGGILFRERIVSWLLRALGMASCFYATYDIMSDVMVRPDAPSDARMLAEYTHFPPFISVTQQTLFWGLLWMGISLVASFYILAISTARSRRRDGP